MPKSVRIELDVEVVDETIGAEPGRRTAIRDLHYRKTMTLADEIVSLGPFEVAASGVFPNPIVPQTLTVDLPDLDPTRMHLLVVCHERLVSPGAILLSIARREIVFQTTAAQWFLGDGQSITMGAATFGTAGEPDDSYMLLPEGFVCSSARFGFTRHKVYINISLTEVVTEVMLHYLEFIESPTDLTEMWP